VKTGPNRKITGSSVFHLDEPRPATLGKVGRTDFSTYPDAEREILDTVVKHRSRLRAEQNAPDLRPLQQKIEGLAHTIEDCRAKISSFLNTGEDSSTKLEFTAAISDLLLDHDLDRLDMDLAMAETIDDLGKVGIYLSAAKLAIEARVSNGEVVDVSSRRARDDFYRRLHRILARHGLDQGVGENSLIVLLVLHLDGKGNLSAGSGPEASKEAKIDPRRRKDLAAEIKAAVNPRRGE
jgi:hypothetical protein